MGACGQSLFGSGSNYIKFGNGEILAIEGSGIAERLNWSELRMPYKQILKGRVILKAGQANYLLNHLGLGDNATFLAIKATYNPKSVIPDDNYVQWSFYDDLGRVNTFAQCMVLTGNNTNRVKQLYLTNPNTKYAVQLDIMCAVIDDQYSIFTDTLNQTATTFTGLEYTDIKTWVINESIVVYDKNTPKRALIYFGLPYINSISISGRMLTIDDESFGTVFLYFLTDYDARQALSIINYVLENPNIDIDSLSPQNDDISPVIHFNSTAGVAGSFISFNGATSGVPYNTGDGFTFSTSISLSTYGTAGVIYKDKLRDLLIDFIDDNRDGIMYLMDSQMIISGTATNISSITQVGTYSLQFNFEDLAENNLQKVIVNLDITS